ncbi:hypothetical protein BE20_11140 [Sorangium cellulosum]|uniref:Uncharacterized protein n=1 Tax=Sorangium cellulosum TaxID=56 RepID=A0A150SHD4_SORCE|nr:hypothetical protein BE18_06865 [Sorangium cellulosum]KYF92682.1 hypothetical protein BE20_11140 [Sorangium cellulosum]
MMFSALPGSCVLRGPESFFFTVPAGRTFVGYLLTCAIDIIIIAVVLATNLFISGAVSVRVLLHVVADLGPVRCGSGHRSRVSLYGHSLPESIVRTPATTVLPRKLVHLNIILIHIDL